MLSCSCLFFISLAPDWVPMREGRVFIMFSTALCLARVVSCSIYTFSNEYVSEGSGWPLIPSLWFQLNCSGQFQCELRLTLHGSSHLHHRHTCQVCVCCLPWDLLGCPGSSQLIRASRAQKCRAQQCPNNTDQMGADTHTPALHPQATVLGGISGGPRGMESVLAQ